MGRLFWRGLSGVILKVRLSEKSILSFLHLRLFIQPTQATDCIELALLSPHLHQYLLGRT